MGFRVLAVGGTGQVGSAVVRALLAARSCTEVVMVNRPKRSWNQTPQQSQKPWGVRITRNDAGAKNCQTFKSEAPHRIFFFAHDARIANPAAGCASCRREQAKLGDSGEAAATCKPTDDAEFESFQFFFAPAR